MFSSRKIFFVSVFVIWVFSPTIVAQTTERAVTSAATTSAKPNRSCNCSLLKIASDLDVVKAGDTVEFYIVSEDGKLLSSSFEWTTSSGEIISGQGTSKIQVKTSADILKPKPIPSPSPADPKRFILFGGSNRRMEPFTVSVRQKDEESCGCPPAQAKMNVGRQSFAANRPANVVSLELDKSRLILSCKPGQIPSEQAGGQDTIVRVSTTAKDPEDDVLTYEYVVSGGRIIGSGANVQWYLKDVLPGTYTITVGADDGCGICGKKITREIKVEACIPTTSDITCPVVTLYSADTTNNRGVYTVIANFSGGSQNQAVTYSWSITGGSLVSGQGTPSVVVRPDQSKTPTVATVSIGGIPSEGSCLNEASITLPKLP